VTGARGVMAAVMLSAIMSSLTSIFNSTSTLFTMDIWRKIRPGTSQQEMMIVGRLAVAVTVVLSVLWIPVMKQLQESQMFIYLNMIMCYLASPVTAIYLLGIFYDRINETVRVINQSINIYICILSQMIFDRTCSCILNNV
jgi:uncharacterized sodium:solute symporter family permease YidK